MSFERLFRLAPKNEEEFNKWLDKLEYLGDMIVSIKLKYDHEKEYRYTNEYLSYEGNFGEWVWKHDWWEGEQEVEYLGAIMVDDIEVPMFKEFVEDDTDNITDPDEYLKREV